MWCMNEQIFKEGEGEIIFVTVPRPPMMAPCFQNQNEPNADHWLFCPERARDLLRLTRLVFTGT